MSAALSGSEACDELCDGFQDAFNSHEWILQSMKHLALTFSHQSIDGFVV